MTTTSPPVLWNDSTAMPVGMSLDQLLYRIRRSDAEDGLIFDSVTLDDVLEEADAIFELDALVATQSSLGRKVRSLERIMNAGGGELSVTASQVSSPFRRQGVVNVAAIFELSDGQTVTIMFHNPDAASARSLQPSDDLISWKWLLNKKDITIVVAPERGTDQPIRQVARRIMRLAEKNSKAFARQNQRRAERMAYIDGLKGEIGELETELDSLTRQIEIAQIEAEDAALSTPKPLSKREGLDLLDELRPWLSRQQYRAMADVIRKGEEGAAYIDRAQALASIIDGMAKSYEQDGKGMEATAYLHYFRGGGDWYITEKDAKGDGTEQAFGWSDPGMGHGELGYIGVDELTDAGVELDLYFEPKPLGQAVATQEASQGGEDDDPEPPVWASDADAIKALSDEEFSTTLAELEGDNARTEATLLLAKRHGTPEQIAEAERLAEEHGRSGEDGPSQELLESRDALRAALEPTPADPPAEPTGQDTPTGVNAEGELEPEGAENVVKTAKGTEVQTGFTVVEADELIASHDINGDPNPAFPTELQPRDRGRDASIAWVKKTARQLDPDSLGRTRRADTGAPIVGPDRVVESGNGRTMAIQEAYRSGSADEYREWLIEEAHHYNLDAGRVRAMKAPVLVRVRTSAIDRREFAVEANQDDKLSMTGTEKARADADRLDDALVAKLADDGNLLAASNRDFIMGFLQSLGDTEAAQYMTSDGNPTGALIARVQAAIFAKAYNDDRLLEMTADASKPEVANVINALNVAAPEFIRAQAADQAGTDALTNQLVDSVETSLNAQAVQAIIDATNLVRRAKADGASVEEAVNQMGLFGDIPPATAAMALFINQNNRSAKRLGLAFRAMAEFVRQEAERGQTVDMFGEGQQASLEEIIAAANRELEKEYGEGSYAIESLDLFSAPPAEPAEPSPEPEAPSEDDIEQARQATDTDPSEEEKESGDYAKGEVEIHGLTIAIENPKGSERSGTTQEGDSWAVSMAHDYGYIKGTKGADGDEVDAFIGPDLDSERVFVVNQVGKDGSLDEHKVMLGFATREAAEQGYLSSYRAGWDGMGDIEEMSVDELKAWLPSAAQGESARAPQSEEEAAAADPMEQARAVTQRDEFRALTADFTRSLATIKGIDAGTIPGMERSLFVNSIAGKIKTRAKRDPLLGAVLLAWLAEQQKDWDKPAITSRNAVWKAADDWESYRPLFNRDAAPSDGQEAGEGEGGATPEPAAPESEEEAMRRNDRQFLQSVIDGTVPDILSPELADKILAVMERQSGDEEMEDLIERAGAAYERAMLSATEEL